MASVTVNGVRLGYRQAGDPAAPPALLLHGSGSGAGTWDRFTPRLTAAGYRSIAVDLRGHGASGRSRDYALASLRDDVLGLLDAFDLREAVLIGHSVGAYAALAASREAPGRIAGLVLEDLAAPPRVASSPAVPGNPLRILAGVAGILGARRDYDLRALASLLRQLTRPDAGWWEKLPGVRHPTLILSGGPASCIPPGRLAEVATAIAGARLVTIPVGHRVHSLAPDRFATAVLSFLAARVEQPAVTGG